MDRFFEAPLDNTGVGYLQTTIDPSCLLHNAEPISSAESFAEIGCSPVGILMQVASLPLNTGLLG